MEKKNEQFEFTFPEEDKILMEMYEARKKFRERTKFFIKLWLCVLLITSVFLCETLNAPLWFRSVLGFYIGYLVAKEF